MKTRGGMRIVDELSTVIAVASTEPRENTRRNKPRWKEACHPQRASTEPRENTRRNLREDDLVRISLHASTEPRENTRRNTQYCGSVHKLRQLQRSRVKTRGGIKGLEGIYFEGVVNGFASGGGVWSGGPLKPGGFKSGGFFFFFLGLGLGLGGGGGVGGGGGGGGG